MQKIQQILETRAEIPGDMDEEDWFLPTPSRLTTELKRKNICGFRDLLPRTDEETLLLVFEAACQTPDSDEFIKECIYIGCDVNKLNAEHQKRPINLILEIFCKDNLEALLFEPTANIDDKCLAWSGQTPINFLMSRIDDENFEQVFSCIKILVEHLANVNIPDNENLTPIMQLLHREGLHDTKKREVLAFLFENAIEVDIDSNDTRQSLEEKFPDLHLPPARGQTDEKWHFARLRQCLIKLNEVEFLKGMNSIVEWSEKDLQQLFEMQDGKFTLLTLAVENCLAKAVVRMLRLGADINFKPPGHYTFTPIEYACRNGFWRILEIFLRSPKTNTTTNDPLLSMTIQHIVLMDESSDERDYKKCFQMLLKAPKLNVDQLDARNCSPLYYAMKHNEQELCFLLLKKGAYIGFDNILHILSNVHPSIFEQYLDGWITTVNRRKGIYYLSEGSFEIQFDYKNLVSASFKRIEDHACSTSNTCNACANEMQPIDYISKSKELQHFLKHPLIQSFLFLKWQRLALIFYLNILAFSMFSVSVLSYILTSYLDKNGPHTTTCFFWWLSIFTTFLIALRELLQVLLSPDVYRRSLQSYLELIVMAMVIFVLCDFDVIDSHRRAIAAVTILLVTTQLFISLGSLGIFSIHFNMLIAVLMSFIRGLSLYIIILVAFALSFFALLNESSYEREENSNGTANEPEIDFNKFSTVGLSLMKVFVMLSGEYEMGSTNFEFNPLSYWLFLIFLFLVSTVLFNLLNGLAVSDIQKIRDEAELTNLKQRVNMLTRYETILFGKHVSWCFNKRLIPSGISIFKYLSYIDYKIQVLPQAKNYVDTDLQYVYNVFKFCCIFGGFNLRMPNNIMELAEQVLHKKKIEQNEKTEKQHLFDRISNLERKLDSLLLMLAPK